METITWTCQYLDIPKPRVLVKENLNGMCYAKPMQGETGEIHFSQRMLNVRGPFTLPIGRLDIILHEVAHLVAERFIHRSFESCHNELFKILENQILSCFGLQAVGYGRAYASRIVRLSKPTETLWTDTDKLHSYTDRTYDRVMNDKRMRLGTVLTTHGAEVANNVVHEKVAQAKDALRKEREARKLRKAEIMKAKAGKRRRRHNYRGYLISRTIRETGKVEYCTTIEDYAWHEPSLDKMKGAVDKYLAGKLKMK